MISFRFGKFVFSGRQDARNSVKIVLAISSFLDTWKNDFSEPERNRFWGEKAIFQKLKEDAFSWRQNNPDAISSVLPKRKKDFFRTLKKLPFQLKRRFFRTWKGTFLRVPEQHWSYFVRFGDLKQRFFRTWKKSILRWKGDFSAPESGRFFMAPDQPWRNFYLVRKKLFFQTR